MPSYVEYRLTKQGDETATWEAMREIGGKSRRQVMKMLREEDERGDANGPHQNVQRKVRLKD
jgi:hypothetical protein